MTVAVITVLMVMIMVMVMIVAVALLIMVMMVMMLVVMIVTVAFLTMFVVVMVVLVVMFMVMMVIVTAGTFVLIHIEIDATVIHRMHHRMFEITFVHICDGGHEVEIRLFRGFQAVVVLHTDVEICKIESYPFSVDGDGHLDVAHQITGLLLDPPADLHHHRVEPCFGICVESVYVSGETDTYTASEFL